VNYTGLLLLIGGLVWVYAALVDWREFMTRGKEKSVEVDSHDWNWLRIFHVLVGSALIVVGVLNLAKVF
jgi:hypothetical protein